MFTIPSLLRPLLRRRRGLLIELGRAGAEATVELVRRGAGREVRRGLVVSVATAGDLSAWLSVALGPDAAGRASVGESARAPRAACAGLRQAAVRVA